MLFGLNVSTSAEPGADPVADARRAEELGFDFVSANDHLHGGSPTYETWTMLSWIAAGTSRIRVASRVLAVPYRNPAVLAKMAETFDRLSGGRPIRGLGGGACGAGGGPRPAGGHLRLQPRGPGGRASRYGAVGGVGPSGGRGRPAAGLPPDRVHGAEPRAVRPGQGRAGGTAGARGGPRAPGRRL